MSLGDWITASCFLIYAPAAVAYGAQGDWGKCLYFIGAIVITVSLLIMKG